MASRKKKWVLLRGKLSGNLIVASREWYESKVVASDGLWKLVTQNDDYDVLNHMMKLGNPPKEPLWDDTDNWVNTKRR
jgi:hypothetical protein